MESEIKSLDLDYELDSKYPSSLSAYVPDKRNRFPR